MAYLIVGLGNPGEEYDKTRHNVGRMALESFMKKNNFSDWEFNKKINALVSLGKIGKHPVTLVLPETFMNKSGNTVKALQPKPYTLKSNNLVIVHDDLDMPLGTMKIVFNRGTGGHRGVESIVKALKTKEFARMRIGISPKKKLHGEAKINDFILGKFRLAEMEMLKKIFKKINGALEAIVVKGRERAMNEYN